MVGPNPYPLHTFLELRKGLGRHWIACAQCRRYSPIPKKVELWDTRTTTFSCSLCGGPGHLIYEKHPDKESFQPDHRAWPERHPWAVQRLKIAERVAGQFEPLAQYAPSAKASRESMPQREKPRRDRTPEPTPIYKPAPLPFRTFRQARDFGLSVHIFCPGCHGDRPLDLSDALLDRTFTGPRFVCRRDKRKLYGDGFDVCGRRGYIVFRSMAGLDRERPYVVMSCAGHTRRLHHTGWEIEGADLASPPWAGLIDIDAQRFACPGCSGIAGHSFVTPYTKGG